MAKKDKLFKGARQETMDFWPWLYWALKDQPIEDSARPALTLRKRIVELGGPDFPSKPMWDKMRSFKVHGFVKDTYDSLELLSLAHKNVPKNPYPEKELEGPAQSVGYHLEIDPLDTLKTIAAKENGRPSLSDTVDSVGLQTQEMSIEQRLVAISHLADSILIQGIPSPPSPEVERQEILDRLAHALEASEKLRRTNRELSEKVYAQTKTIDNLRFVNARLERNISSLTKGKAVDDRAFNEMKNLQQAAPGH